MGKRVALVEAKPLLGGAGVNTGTLPSKTLRESALYLSGLDQRGLFGVDYNLEGGITLDRFLYRKEQVVRKQLQLIAANLERHNIDVIEGRATLVDPHLVRVDKPGGTSLLLSAGNLLIATGSTPYRPAEVPFDDHTVYDSDTILQLDKIPKSLTIIGAGAIGCEYACVFAALGVEVILIDSRDRIVPFLDGEIGDLLSRRMKRLGIEILLEEAPAGYEVEPDRVCTCLKAGGQVQTEKLLYASGRNGVTRDMGLEAVGIEASPRGQIKVNEHFQTSVPHIYAAGDVIGFPALASTSMEQGRVAVCHAFDPGYCNRIAPILPYGLYTIPEISMAGETEESLREKAVPYVVGRGCYENNERGQIIGDTEGLVKLLFSPETRKLLGVHIIGEDATELIHIGTICLFYSGSIDCLIETVFNVPTLSDAYKDAAYDGLAHLSREAPPDRRAVTEHEGTHGSPHVVGSGKVAAKPAKAGKKE
jgi:NAD(P) transhydrogenase